MNEEKLLDILLKDYPDCEIKHISQNNYYNDIRALALDNGLTVTQYLAELGFIVSRGSLDEEEAILELMEAFPDGKVHSLLTNHNKATRTLTQIAEETNRSLDELLADYGMKVVRKGRLTPEEAIEELKKDFPDGKLFSLTNKYGKLKSVLDRAAKERGITLKDLLVEHGMEIVRKMRERDDVYAVPVEVAALEKEKYLNKTKYDEELMKELVEEYNFTASDFAAYLGVTRQAIDLKMKRIKRSFLSWEVKELPKEHFDFLKEMLKEEIASGQSDTYYYQISFNPKRKVFAFTLFPKDLSDFPMCWRDESLPEELIRELFEKDYHIFNNNDFLKLQNIKASNPEEYSSRNGSLFNIFRNLVQKHYDFCSENGVLTDFYSDDEQDGNKFEQFAKYKGFKYESQDNRSIPDEEIIEILESFKNPVTNNVKIPIDDPQYHRVVMLAKNRGYSFKTFIESFGYNYRRTRFFDENFKEKIRKKRLDRLEKYKVTEDSVYISSYAKFYNYLTNEGRSKGYNLTDYLLNEFGLKRVEHKDLPDGYIPYELGESEEDLDKEEKFLKHIESHLMLSDEESYFYINSGTKFYWSILKYTTLIGTSVDDFFEKWELKRLNYQDSINYLINELDFTEEQAAEFLDRTQAAKYSEEGDEDKEEGTEHPFVEEESAKGPDAASDEKESPDDDSETAEEQNDVQENDEDVIIAELDEDELLDFLKKISNQVVDVASLEEKKKRSQLLVRKMKELYGYKCQLCDPSNPIPAIEMLNGLEYVEMHHIIAISNSSAEDETDLILDSYANCVVVCSHHHKMLHYHKGGFVELDEMIDGLYFVNDETELKIFTNKHLSL